MTWKEAVIKSCHCIITGTLAYSANDPHFETHLEVRVRHSLTVHPTAYGTWWKHWGDNGSEERNWPLYLTREIKAVRKGTGHPALLGR